MPYANYALCPFQHKVPRGGTPKERTRHLLPNIKPNPSSSSSCAPPGLAFFKCLARNVFLVTPRRGAQNPPKARSRLTLNLPPSNRTLPAGRQQKSRRGAACEGEAWCARVVCRTSSRQEGEQATPTRPLMRNIGRKGTLYLTQRKCISRRATTHTHTHTRSRGACARGF